MNYEIMTLETAKKLQKEKVYKERIKMVLDSLEFMNHSDFTCYGRKIIEDILRGKYDRKQKRHN